MRILLLTQWFQPEPFFKGLPLAAELQARGHDVQVLTGFPNYPGGKLYPGYRVRPWQREVFQGVSVTRVPLYPSHNKRPFPRSLNYLSFAASAASLGPCLVRSPDVVYVYNLVTLGVAAGLLRLLHRCRLVLDVQDLWPESITGSGMLGSRTVETSWSLRLLSRWCRREYRRPDRVVVQSPGFKQDLMERGVPGQRIKVIYNWCDESQELPSNPTGDWASDFAADGRFHVLFAGTMGVMQGLDVVVAAARKLQQTAPDICFVLAGDGVEKERLEHESQGLTNIRFIGRQRPEEMGNLYASADALLVHLKDVPSHLITIPSKTQAYLFAGKPILCGVAGDTADLVRLADAGIAFQPDDVDSLVDAVTKVSTATRQQRQAWGDNGREYYQRHLCFHEGVSHLEEVFTEVCDQSRKSVG